MFLPTDALNVRLSILWEFTCQIILNLIYDKNKSYYEWIHASYFSLPVDRHELYDAEHFLFMLFLLNRLIARQLAKIHAIHAHNGWIPKSNLWLKMGKYFSLIPTGFADEDINKR